MHHAANVGDEFYGKITASLGPVFDKINKTLAGEVFSFDSLFGLPEVKLEEVIKRKKILYVGLDSMTNKPMADAVAQALIADLLSLIGRLYKTGNEEKFPLMLHIDEFAEVVREEAITLLNKASGAGVWITAYTQTKNDIGASFGGNRDKAEMILGNFGNKVVMRVANEDTARIVSDASGKVKVRTAVPNSSVNDRAVKSGGERFGTSNSETITETYENLLSVNDLMSLPKGQAFVLTNGGEIYKVRFPLPKNDGNAPRNFAAIMSEVNL